MRRLRKIPELPLLSFCASHPVAMAGPKRKTEHRRLALARDGYPASLGLGIKFDAGQPGIVRGGVALRPRSLE